MRLDLADPWPFGGHAIHHAVGRGQHRDVPARGARRRSADARDGGMAPVVPQARRPLVHRPRRCTNGTTRTSRPGELVDPPPGPWDDTFTGLAGSAGAPAWPDGVTATISSTCDYWVIFTKPDHALCVEPQTGPPNEFNHETAVVAPGAPWSPR